jgi:hypothetical protein
VQVRFDQDEVETATNILHYSDITLSEPSILSSTSEMVVTTPPTELNGKQWKPLLSHQLSPPVPTRPSKEELAEIMDISYVEWDDNSFEDTTADSRLADWLATFADHENLSSANEAISKESSRSVKVRPGPAMQAQYRPGYESPNHNSRTSQYEQAEDTSITQQVYPSVRTRPLHRRVFSEPLEHQPNTIKTRRLPEKAIKTPARSFSEGINSQSQPVNFLVSKPLDTPILNTPAQSSWMYTSPSLDSKRNTIITGDGTSLHSENCVDGENYSKCVSGCSPFNRPIQCRF